ncbi:MAG: hypothetical protein HY744_23135, partial [Deltaproteobacteria bacterium]|nr:hypothetical protein [Deltaproteobacteria bacterium]
WWVSAPCSACPWRQLRSRAGRRDGLGVRGPRQHPQPAHWTRAPPTAHGTRPTPGILRPRRSTSRDHSARFSTKSLKNELPPADDEDGQDRAAQFLEFVKRRAGLLIEVGDERYSFVHLTFEEYLTASHLITQGESGGIEAIWEEIEEHRGLPVWHEVIRLLVASLKAAETQQTVVQRMLDALADSPDPSCARLLGGFLLDGIEAADDKAEQIGHCLLAAVARARDGDELHPVLAVLRGCARREHETRAALEVAFRRLWQAAEDDEQRLGLALVVMAGGWSFAEAMDLTGGFPAVDAKRGGLLRILSDPAGQTVVRGPLPGSWEVFVAGMQSAAMMFPETSLLASTSQALAVGLGFDVAARTAFRLLLTAIAGGRADSFENLVKHSCLVAGGTSVASAQLGRARALARVQGRALDWAPTEAPAFWSAVSGDRGFRRLLVDVVCGSFDLRPRPQWEAAIETVFVPSVPARMVLMHEQTWQRIERAFETGCFGSGDVYAAAWLLLVDSCLWIAEVDATREHALFRRLAEVTREIDEPPLRCAHCIRDLALGDEARGDDLVAMVESDDPAYRRLFEECLWRPTPAEERREAEGAKGRR